MDIEEHSPNHLQDHTQTSTQRHVEDSMDEDVSETRVEGASRGEHETPNHATQMESPQIVQPENITPQSFSADTPRPVILEDGIDFLMMDIVNDGDEDSDERDEDLYSKMMGLMSHLYCHRTLH